MTRRVKKSPKGSDAMLAPEDVADTVVKGLAEERFLILSHPVTQESAGCRRCEASTRASDRNDSGTACAGPSGWLRPAPRSSLRAMNPTPGDPPTPGSTIAGKFRVISQIGKGGMGVVVAAENLVTGKLVAIKWVPRHGSESDARFLREARAAASIRHPNVVDVYDIVEDGDNVFMVMELLEGEPLTAMLRRGDTPAYELIALIIEAMRGVAAAHRKQVIHRDIKPDNIFLACVADRTQRMAKVVDFGISKVDDPDTQTLTQSNTPLGTPLYMSYEQLEARRDVDARTDVYAFGVILYEALTGALPYEANTLAELIFKIVLGPAPAPRQRRPDLPLALDAVVRKAVAKDRADRYGSMEALIDALTPFAARESWAGASLSVTARALSDTIPSQSSHSVRVPARKRVALRSALLALVLVGAAVLWLMFNTPAQTAERARAEPVTDRSAATSQSLPPSAAPLVAADPAQPTAAGEARATPEPPREPAKKSGVSSPSIGAAGRRTPATQGAARSKRPSAANAREQAPVERDEVGSVRDTAESAPPKPASAQTPQDSALRAGRPLLQEF